MQSSRKSKIWPVVRVASGNFLEMYDFQVFGYYAPAIARAFFPTGSEFASLMLALATFGAGFLMRPVGAIVLGAYVDSRGRRAGLLLTLALMALGTLSIASTPSYASIGFIAPVLVLLGRLLQGLSAGSELGGVSVYLSEIATPGHKGFYVSWQGASQEVAVMFTALVGLGLTTRLTAGEMTSWGWRIPLLVGCAIVPLVFVLRRSLEETDAFLKRKRRPGSSEILRALAREWRLVVLGMMLSVMGSVSFYMITAYTPTFASAVLHLPGTDSMLVTLCVGACSFIFLPVMGALSDRTGRATLLIVVAALAMLTAYPALRWLGNAPSFARLTAVDLWFAFLFSSYYGPMCTFLTEIMPAEVRTAGFALAHSCATAFFGGFTPAVSTYLIHATGNSASPGWWLSLAAALGLIAAAVLSGRYQAERRKASGDLLANA